MTRALCSVALLMFPVYALAQTPDPLVLCGPQASYVAGWMPTADPGRPLVVPDAGWSLAATALVAPPSYFEHAFHADAGVYRVWIRLRALANSKFNDSIWVQFNDAVDASGQAVYRIGSAQALLVNLANDSTEAGLREWGWHNGAYWLSQQTTVTFTAPGMHRLRVQVREDGVVVDQIVLSRAVYATRAPGVTTNDTNRLTCTTAGAPSSPAPAPWMSGTSSTALHRLRVMTWNVQSGTDSLGVTAIDAQAALMASSGAHVIALQEVEVLNGADLPELYASKLAELTGTAWERLWIPAPLSAGRPPMGNLILSRLPIAGSSATQFDTAPMDASWNDTKRSAGSITVIVNDVPVSLATTHLPQDPTHRLRHVELLLDWLAGGPGPRLIGGDFNALAGDVTHATMAASFRDSWLRLVGTLDAGITKDVRHVAPYQPGRIDYWWHELSEARVTPTEIWVVKTKASDHHPVVMDLAVRR